MDLDGYGAAKNIDEVGQDFEVTRERVRQIEAKALRKLRHPSRSKNLRILTDFSTDAQVKSYMDQLHERQVRDQLRSELYSEIREEVIGQIARDPSLRRRVDEATAEAYQSGLNHPVDELEVSVRTANCLANLGVQTVGELAAWSEVDLLRTKNFGRKSLKEIKEVLAELNVTLGR